MQLYSLDMKCYFVCVSAMVVMYMDVLFGNLLSVQYSHIERWWVCLTKYALYRKRGSFDLAHAYTLNVDNVFFCGS